MKRRILVIVVVALVLFLFYHGARIYLIEAIMPAPREGAEAYHYTHPDGAKLSFFFLPKYRLIIAYVSADSKCFQLLDQTNRAGRRVFGNVYYLEGSGVFFHYLRAPEGYKPYLYKLTTISTVGTCEEFPQKGAETNLVLFRRDRSLIYYGKELRRQDAPDMQAIQGLLHVLEER